MVKTISLVFVQGALTTIGLSLIVAGAYMTSEKVKDMFQK